MRAIFIKLDGTSTTPTPCKAAQDAYLAHCATMKKDKEDTCEKLAEYRKINPLCDAGCLKNHMDKLVGLKEKIANNQAIINNPKIKKQKVKDAAQNRITEFNKKEKEYLKEINKGNKPKVANEISTMLKELAAREIARKVLLETQKELNQAIKNVIPNCSVPSAITNPDCKK